jgi:pimeloyl-ACP methyl ester carboxylesterase
MKTTFVISCLTFLSLIVNIKAAIAASPMPVKSGYVHVNGMKMYYEVQGTATTGSVPMIVLHGAYMNIPEMGQIIPKLAETHKVYAIEMQGHGRTSDINRPITYQNLADDVAVFMDSMGIKKADIMGYSMGACAGIQLAIRHPEKVNKLIPVSGAYDFRRMATRFQSFHSPDDSGDVYSNAFC